MIETIERMLIDLWGGKLSGSAANSLFSSLPWPLARWQPRARSQLHRRRGASVLSV